MAGSDDYSESKYVALMHFFSVKFVMRCETLVMGKILKSISLKLVLSFFLHGSHVMLCQSFGHWPHCHHCHAIVMGGVQLSVTGLGGGRRPSLVTIGYRLWSVVANLAYGLWAVLLLHQ